MQVFRNLSFNGRSVDLSVDSGRIAAIDPHVPAPGDGRALILAPAFYNCHTHLPMSLLRGYGDDMKLMPWLEERIWPAEARLTPEIAYAGARLAILEMIHSGCVFANDMYWYAGSVAQAAADSGIRCAVAMQTIETGGPGVNDPRNVAENRKLAAMARSAESRVFATYAAHAVYTVCEKSLREIAAAARAEDSFIHIHVSETAGEVEACRSAHDGLSPVAYLDRCGMLGPKTLMAHCVHLDDDDAKLVADRGAVVVENAQSNQKLASGFMPYGRFRAAGCRLALGTDGACSNNSLSMFAEMKCAALQAKAVSSDPTAAPAAEILRAATRGGAEAFGIDGGEIRPGAAADFILLNPDAPALVPGFELASDLVYAADPSCVDTVVCAGRVLMERGTIPGEADVLSAAREAAARLVAAAK